MSGHAITKEGVEVRAGQVWRDLDKRSHGRTVTVEAVLVGAEHVRAKGVRRVELSVRRMCKPYWELVSSQAASSAPTNEAE